MTSSKEERRAQQAQRVARSSDVSARLAAANVGADGQPRDVLAELRALAVVQRGGLALTLRQFARGGGAASSVPAEVLRFCLALTETNMAAMYEAAGWGWNSKKKQRELEDEEARLLVAFDSEERPVAFAHFRFIREKDCPVLYVYELQVESGVGRKGLGRHLMLAMELAALKARMEWVMLTVFKCNTAAAAFYGKLKYSTDETCPAEEDESATYSILSKRLQLSAAPAPAAAPLQQAQAHSNSTLVSS
jgi:ribosomal protein S18 acetylase RimI-like enzyme